MSNGERSNVAQMAGILTVVVALGAAVFLPLHSRISELETANKLHNALPHHAETGEKLATLFERSEAARDAHDALERATDARIKPIEQTQFKHARYNMEQKTKIESLERDVYPWSGPGK